MLTLVCAAVLAFDFGPQVPGQLAEVDVPGAQSAQGVPVKLRAFLSRETEAGLVKHYAQAFAQAGLFMPPLKARRRDVLEPQLTAIDVAALTSYSVLLIRNADRTFTVILGEARVDPSQRRAEPAFLPLPPGAKDVLTSSSEGARVLSFTTPLGADEALAFYRRTLAGWKSDGPGRFATPDGTQVTISATRHGDATWVSAVASLKN